MRTIYWLFFLLVATGCNQGKETRAADDGRPDAYQVVVEPLNETDLARLISDRAGKVLLLNVWATWCVPCKEEFPDLVKLATKYKGTDFEFAVISVDYPDETDSKIKPFLQQLAPNFPVYVRDFEDEQAFINHLNQQWSGALPATFVFDSTGKQRVFLQGKQDYDSLESALQAAVK